MMVSDGHVVIGQCGGCVISLCGVLILGHVVYSCGCVAASVTGLCCYLCGNSFAWMYWSSLAHFSL